MNNFLNLDARSAIRFGVPIGAVMLVVCLGIFLMPFESVATPVQVQEPNKTKKSEPVEQESQKSETDKQETEKQETAKQDSKGSDEVKQEASGDAKQETEKSGEAETAKKDDQELPKEEVDLRPRIIRSAPGNVDKSKPMDLTFDDIKFEMEKGSDFEREMLTPEIVDLDHQVVRLRGFIRPSVRQSDLTKFVFVRDNKECCFGPGAALYDCVLVELDKGEKTDFTVRPVTIEGEFYVKEFKGLNGKIWAIYRMRKGAVK